MTTSPRVALLSLALALGACSAGQILPTAQGAQLSAPIPQRVLPMKKHPAPGAGSVANQPIQATFPSQPSIHAPLDAPVSSHGDRRTVERPRLRLQVAKVETFDQNRQPTAVGAFIHRQDDVASDPVGTIHDAHAHLDQPAFLQLEELWLRTNQQRRHRRHDLHIPAKKHVHSGALRFTPRETAHNSEG